MKLCVECDHHAPNTFGDQCARKTTVSPVNGKTLFADCACERAFDVQGTCGREGRFWIARVEVKAERVA